MLGAKKYHILKITRKFQDSKTAGKTYWAILSRLKEILKAKNNYIIKMTTKLQDPKTAAKTS